MENNSIAIFYGTETGNSRFVARALADEALKRGIAAGVEDIVNITAGRLAEEKRPVVVVISTWNRGRPPYYSRRFFEELEKGAVRMDGLRFAVIALGDENYEMFCQCGRDIDAALEKLGGMRFAARTELGARFRERTPDAVGAVLDALVRIAAD
ncbi:MAG TPA: flavodoxin domain-containing protein [Opitutales bacterium]|nr:flavodoxin domain-containing protein [Opitutales bacterium]